MRALSIAGILVLAFSVLGSNGCNNSGPSPGVQSYPTFVLAWTDENSEIATAESGDAQSWSYRVSHGTGTRTMGPAVAYDGGLNYLLMWTAGSDLVVASGVRGSEENTPLQWDTSPTRVDLPGSANSDGSPALAFGFDRWVAIYPLAGTRGATPNSRALVEIRSDPLQASSWGPAVPARIGPIPLPGGGSISGFTANAPALAFGNLLGVPSFVLVFVAEDQSAIVANSTDGQTWNFFANLGPSMKDPAIAYSNGKFFVTLSRIVSTPPPNAIANFHDYVYKIVGSGAAIQVADIFSTPQSATGPGFALGNCTMIVTEEIGGPLGGVFTGISERTAKPTMCDNPAAASFGADTPVRTFVPVIGDPEAELVGNSGARTALTFGSASPHLPQEVLLAGGFTSTSDPQPLLNTLDQAELYDVQTGVFTLLPEHMLEPRVGFSACLLLNGNILLVGGFGNPGPVPNVPPELFLPATRAFRAAGVLQRIRNLPGVAGLVDGRVLVTGGGLENTFPPDTTSTGSGEIYDADLDAFSLLAQLMIPREVHSSTLLDNGDVLLAGGADARILGLPSTRSAQVFRFATQDFISTGNDLPAPVQSHTATRLDNGLVLVAGGGTVGPSFGLFPAANALAAASLYNPATATFTSVASMHFPRSGHSATLLPNGMVLIAGGDDEAGTPQSSAELFDPQTKSFRVVGNMTAARTGHTATLLENGMVLLAGGDEPRAGINRSAELFDFRRNIFISAGNMAVPRSRHTATAFSDTAGQPASQSIQTPAAPICSTAPWMD